MTFAAARIAARIFNVPLLVSADTAVAIATNLAHRFEIEPMADQQDIVVHHASRFRGMPAGERAGRSMYKAEGDVAVISVLGELVNRGAWIGASSGLTSYEGLDAQLRAAADDLTIRGILLDMNTPGGEATGAMETGVLVRSIATKKPVVAFVNGMAASAGYAIASGASKIVTTPTGSLGSIGVVMLHLDRSAAIEKLGVRPTLIHAGAFKVDGTSLQALPADARARIQAGVNGLYDLFIATVADHRGLDAQAVRYTEGGLLMGRAAIDAGLADSLGTFDDALALLSSPEIRQIRAATTELFDRGARKSFAPAAASTRGPAPAGYIWRDEHEAALAKLDVDIEAVRKAAIANGHARYNAILGSEAAKGREALAQKLAFDSDMSAEAANAILEAAPRRPAVAEAAAQVRRGRLTLLENPEAPEACDFASMLTAAKSAGVPLKIVP